MRLWRQTFFTDVTPLLKLGRMRSLMADDLPDLPPPLDPRHPAIDDTLIQWQDGQTLLRSLIFKARRLWLAPLPFYLASAGFSLLGPILINHFVDQLSRGFTSGSQLAWGLINGLAIGLVGIGSGLLLQQYFHRSLARQQKLTNFINTKIFRHALVLEKEARERIPVGDIVNHLSTDTDSVAELYNALNDLLYCGLMIGGAMGLLFHYMGSTAWVALVLLTLLVPLTRKVSQQFTRYDEELMHHRDRRVSVMAQILNAIRLVKYFAWEKSVAAEVESIRSDELHARRRIARAELIVTVLYVSVGTVVLFVVLSLHTLYFGHTLTPTLVFTCVSLFALLEDPFSFLSRIISVWINAQVGASRIAKFVNQPAAPARAAVLDRGPLPAVGLEVDNLQVRVGPERFTALDQVNFRLGQGQRLAVVGPVGAGKSVLLQALLGEVQPTQGAFSWLTSDQQPVDLVRLAYVPQEAFVLNDSVRANLTLGDTRIGDPEIQHALELAGLWTDVQNMGAGLNTEIGERGINLSGGQRQRLSLARAVLQRPQIVLLDDPLSAVDPNMENHLMQALILGEWRDTTQVFVTHRLAHLRDFEQILFLEEGHVLGLGTFTELLGSCAQFRQFMEEHDRSIGQSDAKVEVTPVQLQESQTAPLKKSSRITEDEDREWGAVRGSVYLDYILSLGGEGRIARPVGLALLALAAAAGTALPLLQKAWLAKVANLQSGLIASTDMLSTWAQQPLTAIYIYAVLGLLVLGGTLLADLFWLQRGLRAGRRIHEDMLSSILNSGIRFFDATPAGRVLQRFSRDMEAIDSQLQWSFENSMKSFAQVLITLVLIMSVLPAMILVFLPVLWVYHRLQHLYRVSAREAKRLDSLARSPRYAHFKETLNGLVVIRAFGRSQWFMDEFFQKLHHSQRMFYGSYVINRWFSSRIPVVGGVVAMTTSCAVVLAVKTGQLTPGMGGLLAVQSLSFWGVLNWGIRIWAEVEARMTSMERVKAYSKLEPEPTVMLDRPLPADWPQTGDIEFAQVSARYAAHLPLILRDVSFHVRSGERVGIVGRTGAGKSTLFQTLYRMVNVERGEIRIDGVDIRAVPLPRLRRALAIIPQDPTLFMGDLRRNLDRYNEFSDAQIWSALEKSAMADVVRGLPKSLSTLMTENGANLSQGQRQLLCLARALLLGAKVIVLDEATASVDVRTDALVQTVLRESCREMTLMIIAHRLGTVADCDQILEVKNGHVQRRQAVGTKTTEIEAEPI